MRTINENLLKKKIKRQILTFEISNCLHTTEFSYRSYVNISKLIKFNFVKFFKLIIKESIDID